jgi:hypothetical protein
MKPTKALLCTITLGALTFAAGSVLAMPGYFNISGTATGEKVTVSTPTKYVQKFDRESFKTKDVLALLAYATGESWFTNKNSHLVYDPDVYNDSASNWYEEEVYGIFWVTNTVSHDLYRLDNASTTNSYWSFIELDYYEWELGFWIPWWYYSSAVGINNVQSGVETMSSVKYKELGSDAILYVHDNPYYFDYANYAYGFWYNSNAAVIRGPLTITVNATPTKAKLTISLSGNGDGMFYDSELEETVYPVLTGKAKWSGKETADEL